MSEKRMSRSPLVANFPMEFSLVPLENLKNGGRFDRPSILQGNRVAIASSFGVISAIILQKFSSRARKIYKLNETYLEVEV